MTLLQDGVIAALAAIGVTALLWLAASLVMSGGRTEGAAYIVSAAGDGAGLDVTLRRLARGERLPVLLVDCGLTGEGRRAVSLLTGDAVQLVTPEELAALYTKEEGPWEER